MKRNLLASLLALCAMAGQAQESQNSSSAPLDSAIIEGVVTNMPDGTLLSITRDYDNSRKDIIIKDGKFRVAVLPKQKEDTYYLSHYSKLQTLYVEPGLKIKVKGDGATTISNWYVESTNHDQKEYNAYVQFAKENVPDYYELENKNSLAYEKRFDGSLTQEERNKATQEDRASRPQLEALKKEKYNAAIIEFMKGRPFSKRMITELYFILLRDDSPAIIENAREVFKKYPQEAMNERYVAETKALLYADKAKIGEQMKDFTLFDREGKKHQLSEFKGKYSVLEFTSIGCGPCKMSKPILDELYKRNKDKMEIIAISKDPEKIWMGEEREVSYHEWNDHQRAAEPSVAYGVTAIPTFVLVDPNGKVLDINTGLHDFFVTLIKYIPDEEAQKMLTEYNSHKH